jgi:hypothetical protein
MLKFMVYNQETKQYENLPREKVTGILGEGATEFLEMCYLPEPEQEEISTEEIALISEGLSPQQREKLDEQIFSCYGSGYSADSSTIVEMIQEIFQERSEDCVCSDQSFSVYGCMCKIRRMPG